MATVFGGLARLALGKELPVQVAAVCYRMEGTSVEFLLVKASSGKWTFPKGRLNPGSSPSESAAQEAWEEAGAKGRVEEKHFGWYLDTKRALWHDAQVREVRIATYLLEVHSTVTPDEIGRNPSWFSSQQAIKVLAEGRSPHYSKRITDIIDAAVERLAVKNRKRAVLLLRAQRRRGLAAAR